jgi:hypothetical protein
LNQRSGGCFSLSDSFWLGRGGLAPFRAGGVGLTIAAQIRIDFKSAVLTGLVWRKGSVFEKTEDKLDD